MVNKRYWIGVASRDHTANGIKWGICQFCHGKAQPLKRMKQGDYLIYYSSKEVMNQPKPCQMFTAIGEISDSNVYSFDMGGGFVPFRRNVKYFPAKHVPIRPLVDILPFITNKKNFGAHFRYGFLEVDPVSFRIIAEQMLSNDDFAKLVFPDDNDLKVPDSPKP